MNNLIDVLKGVWDKVPSWLRWLIIPLILIGIGYYMITKANSITYDVLYTNLSTSDSSAIEHELATDGINYQSPDGGKTIQVDKNQASNIRMRLADVGLPHSGDPGFELFDTSSIGETQFEKDVKYQRALKGQLENDLTHGIDGIERATVQLTIADSTSIFQTDTQRSKATVSLGLRSGVQLDDSQIKGIQNLVAAAVKNLKAQDVVVLDEKGSMLSDSGSDSSTMSNTGNMSKQLQIETQEENMIKDDIMKSLTAVFGYDNVRVNVRATINFDELVRNTEKYDPQGTMTNQHTKTTNNQTNGVTVNQEPGTGTNTSTPFYDVNSGGTGNKTSDQSNEVIQNFDVGKTVETLKKNPQLTNLNVVVWVDKTMSQSDIATLKQAVTVAAGISKNGTVEIVPVIFNQNAVSNPGQDTQPAAQSFISQNKTTLIVAGLIAFMIAFVIGAGLRSRGRERKARIQREQQMLINRNMTAESSQRARETEQVQDEKEIAKERNKTMKEKTTEVAEREPKRTSEYISRLIEE